MAAPRERLSLLRRVLAPGVTLVLALGLTLGLAGCGGAADVAADVAVDAASKVADKAGSTSDGAAEGAWVTVKEPRSGVTVELPRKATFKSVTGRLGEQDLERRQGFVRSDGTVYGLTVLTLPDVPAREDAIPASSLGQLFYGYARALGGTSTMDYQVFDLHDTTVAGHDAMTGRITLTGMRDHPGYARLVVVPVGNTLVVLQTLGYEVDGHEDASDAVSDGFDRLLGSVEIPDGVGLGTGA